MKLYYKTGACSLASHIILNELNLSFKIEAVDTIKGITQSGIKYDTINPNGYVPALTLDNGNVITENIAILQYLANLNPNKKLVPSVNSFSYTKLQELLGYLATELHKAFSPFFSNQPMDSVSKKIAELKITKGIQTIENILNDGRPHLMGEQYTVVDAYAFVIINWTNFIDFSLTPWPNVELFMQRIYNRPASQKAMTSESLITSEEM